MVVAAGGILKRLRRKFVKTKVKSRGIIAGDNEDRISALLDDLLVRVLCLVPTKDAVATMILSKRWQFIWTMVPPLEYQDINHGTHKSFLAGLFGRLISKNKKRSVWRFLNESLRLNKAHVLERLTINLGPQCPIDIDVGKWIAYAVERKVRELCFNLMWSAKPTNLPNSLYTCDTLVCLCLTNKVFVDVSSPICLSSLEDLGLGYVVYKDEDSLVRVLSSCHVLKRLFVVRHDEDNITKFNIKVPSLEYLLYYSLKRRVTAGTLVVDSPALKQIVIADYSRDDYLIENKPCFDKAKFRVVCYPDNNFMKSLSSVTHLEILLSVTTVECCIAINFSRLMECKITLLHDQLDWLEPLLLLLENSPNLKVLVIDQETFRCRETSLASWNQPSSVSRCLSTHLEIFEWDVYGGRSEEKEAVRCIFANSKCLKRAVIVVKPGETKLQR